MQQLDFSDIEEEFGDQIYRPGEDIDEEMTDEEKTERRHEIEEMFGSGLTDFDSNGDSE